MQMVWIERFKNFLHRFALIKGKHDLLTLEINMAVYSFFIYLFSGNWCITLSIGLIIDKVFPII